MSGTQQSPDGDSRSGGTWALAMHGGAGPLRAGPNTEAEAHMAHWLKVGSERLKAGVAALDVVAELVEALEQSSFHIAGRGASPNRAGEFELDASLMCGSTRRAGAVAALVGFASPIRCAEAVMKHTPHVMLVGSGAKAFCAEQNLPRIETPESWFKPAVPTPLSAHELAHGTVGVVARDTEGQLAAGTSTGGLLGKQPGRVGDSPIIGAGTWADERVAVSCTGQGEYFLRAVVAADVSARMRYGRQSLAEAAAGALQDMALLGGDGGLIAVDVLGNIAIPFTSPAMKRGYADWRGRFEVSTFR
jgi:L-asparaginase/beta-aspartyl-peptidase (threonine type)